MEVLNRAAIKAEARGFIGQDNAWLKLFLAILPLCLLGGGISTGVTFWRMAAENGDVQQMSVSTGSNVLSLLLIPFTVSMAGFFLNAIRGFNPEWKSLYKEGIDRYGKYFAVGFITNLFIGLWMLLFIVPGVIKAFEYAQVHYIIHDNPNLSPAQARSISRRMTDGFKSELFILELSFILWYLLAGVTCGIAVIYVMPYVQTTRAMYYENLKNHALSTGRAVPEEFGIFPPPPYGAPQNPYAAGQSHSGNAFDGAQPPFANGADCADGYAAQQPPEEPNAQNFTPPAPEDTFKPGSAADLGEATRNGSHTESERWRY